MLILFESFLGILPLDSLFSFHHLVPRDCPRIWHIKNSTVSLWNPRYSERWFFCILQALSVNFYLVMMRFSHESEHTKLMTSLIRWIPIKPGRLPGTFLWSRLGRFCWARKPRKFSGFRKAASLFCKWQCRRWPENSLCTILITLWSVFFFLKVRWPSERSFISTSLIQTAEPPVSFYSSALRDALYLEIESLLELRAQTSWALRWRLPVGAK